MKCLVHNDPEEGGVDGGLQSMTMSLQGDDDVAVGCSSGSMLVPTAYAMNNSASSSSLLLTPMSTKSCY